MDSQLARVDKVLENLHQRKIPPFLLGDTEACEQFIEIKSLLTDYMILLYQAEQIRKVMQANDRHVN